MIGLVHGDDDKAIFPEFDFVDCAGMLANTPIMGERSIKGVEENNAVDAVVRDQDDGLIRMRATDGLQGGGHPCPHLLQALAAGDLYLVGRPIPEIDRRGPARLCFVGVIPCHSP